MPFIGIDWSKPINQTISAVNPTVGNVIRSTEQSTALPEIKQYKDEYFNPALGYQLNMYGKGLEAVGKGFRWLEAQALDVPLTAAAFYLQPDEPGLTMEKRIQVASDIRKEGKEKIKAEGVGGLLPEGTPGWQKEIVSMAGPASFLPFGLVGKGLGAVSCGVKALSSGAELTGTVAKGLTEIERVGQTSEGAGLVAKFFNKINPTVKATFYDKAKDVARATFGDISLGELAFGPDALKGIDRSKLDRGVTNAIARKMMEEQKGFSPELAKRAMADLQGTFGRVIPSKRAEAFNTWYQLESELEKGNTYVLKNEQDVLDAGRSWVRNKAQEYEAVGLEPTSAYAKAQQSFLEKRVNNLDDLARGVYGRSKQYGWIPVLSPKDRFVPLGPTMPEAKMMFVSPKTTVGKALQFMYPVLTERGSYSVKADKVITQALKYNPGKEDAVMDAIEDAVKTLNAIVYGKNQGIKKTSNMFVKMFKKSESTPRTIGDLSYSKLNEIGDKYGLRKFGSAVKSGNVQPFYQGGLRTLTETAKAQPYKVGETVDTLSAIRRNLRWNFSPVYQVSQVTENAFNKVMFGNGKYGSKLVEAMRSNPETAQAIYEQMDIGKVMEKGLYGGDVETMEKISASKLPGEIERLAQGTKYENMKGAELMNELESAMADVQKSFVAEKKVGISEEFENALARKVGRDKVQLFKDALKSSDNYGYERVWGTKRGGLEKSINLALFPTSYNKRLTSNMIRGLGESSFYRNFVRLLAYQKQNYEGRSIDTAVNDFLDSHPEYFPYSNVITNYISGQVGAGPQLVERIGLTLMGVYNPATGAPYKISSLPSLISPQYRLIKGVGDAATKFINK